MSRPVPSPSVKDDPVAFATQFMHQPDGTPLIPHEGQVELLTKMRGKKQVVACCGRQWGKSVGMSIYTCWFAVTKAHRQIYIVAPTVDQSRIIFNEVANQFRTGPLSTLVVGKINEYPFPRIKLANGTEIHGRGANSPQFLRGKPAHLIIVDEAAFCKDLTITNVIEPMLTVTGKKEGSALVLISTPFGLGAFKEYYDAALVDETGISLAVHFTSFDNPHADRSFLERVKKRYGADSMVWRTEYLAEFVDDDLAVFPSSLIKYAYESYVGEYPKRPVESHRYVQGVDLANVRDFFVSCILDATDQQRIELVNMTRLQKKGYTEYKRIIRAEHHRYQNADTLIDATSLGESVVEDLGDIAAEGYKFSNASKNEIVHELERAFAEKRLTIPYDRDLISELLNFQYEFTPSKVVKMEAKKGHDDMVMALALAIHLAIIRRSLGFFQGVSLTPSPVKPPPVTVDPFAELFKFED